MSTQQQVVTKPIAQSQDEIHVLLNVSSQGGLIWDSLLESTRTVLCRASGLKQRHINLALNKFNDLERAQLLKSIKSLCSIDQEIKRLAYLSLQEFK